MGFSFAGAPFFAGKPQTGIVEEVDFAVTCRFYVKEMKCRIIDIFYVILLTAKVNYKVTKLIQLILTYWMCQHPFVGSFVTTIHAQAFFPFVNANPQFAHEGNFITFVIEVVTALKN